MRLNVRAYPYPVLGRADDFPQDAFDADVDMVLDGNAYQLTVEVKCTNESLVTLIEHGLARYVVHFECARTMNRGVELSSVAKFLATVPRERIVEQLDVNTMIVATSEIPRYRPVGAHPHFDQEVFRIEPGNILAVGETVTFDVTPDPRAGRISAFMHVMRSPLEGDLPMQVDLNGDKIAVILSKSDFQTYHTLKHHPGISHLLSTTLVLPALVEALRVLAEAGNAQDGKDLRWMAALESRLTELGLQPSTDLNECLKNAQVILDFPFKRSLGTAMEMVLADA